MKVAIAFLALASAVALADNCLTGHTWPQGQQGNVQVTVPADTKKWRIALTFDTPPNRIHAAQGKNERCSPRKKMCFFNSEKYNMKTILSPQLEDQKSNLTYWTQPSPEHQVLPSVEEEKDPVSVVKIVSDSMDPARLANLNGL